ncbi:MAG: DUF1800 domain-containing protein [Armatimonadetes bacterium]|nr:DUF1800 domain-containing protein [Armatimonadota bacterium]
MEVSRREVLGAAAVVGAGLAAGCSPLRPSAPKEAPKATSSEGYRFLSRAGFGPGLGESTKFSDQDRRDWIEMQLRAEQDEPAFLTWRLSRLDILRIEGWELGDMPEEEIIRQLQQAALLRAIYSPNQLRERMVDFWTNHFNIYSKKADGAYAMTGDQESVIRKNALGSFPAMLRASATSPAMLNYLDNKVNRAGVANENYAREILELHTLGLGGGYTQQDIREVARCFTGWTIENRFLRARGRFRFREEWHDATLKKVFEQKITEGGIKDGERVLDMISVHPSTAKHLSRKLCEYFLGTAPANLTEGMSERFLATRGDIKETLKPLLESKEILGDPQGVRRPFDFVVAILRATGADTDARKGLEQSLTKMGQDLFKWPMPDGFPTETSSWTGSMLPRWNFVHAFSQNSIPGTKVDWQALEKLFTNTSLNETTHALAGRDPVPGAGPLTDHVALLFASPEFQWK